MIVLTPDMLYKLLLAFAMGAALLCKLLCFLFCIKTFIKTPQYRVLISLLIVFLLGGIVEDAADLTSHILRSICGLKGCISSFTFLCRLAWALTLPHFQALALFINLFVSQKLTWKPIHLLLGLVNLMITSCFFYLAFFEYHTPASSPTTLPYEVLLVKIVYILIPLFFAPALIQLFTKEKRSERPQIINHQLRTFLFFLIPYLFLRVAASSYSYLAGILPFEYKYLFYAIKTLLSTVLFIVAGTKMLRLRFLNIRKEVKSSAEFNFLGQFKDILEQVRYVTGIKELSHLCQTFFQTAFGIPLARTSFILRDGQTANADHRAAVTEAALRSDNKQLLQVIARSKIAIKDDVQFSYYCEKDPASLDLLKFLESLDADIFLPIYERNEIIASIVIARNARPDKLFTNKERDEMLLFATYLSTIITSIKYSNVESLQQYVNQINQELYHKHQEIMQYKESMRSFLKINKEHNVAVLFYKNRKFTYANEASHEMIGIDLNAADGHYLTQTLKNVARKVTEYKTSQSAFSVDQRGTKILVTGIPSPELSTILLLSYPDATDIIKAHLEQLKDPSHWDYLLYLETTQSGQIVNELIPGYGETLLHFKIKLLEAALSKKATLLTVPEEDLMTTVEILHAISLRKTLHVLKLTNPEKHDEIALTLFGLNPLMQKDANPSLLEKLNTIGTLFIENIEYLGKETQEYLARFIALGFFNKYKSNHKVVSNVRIMCSTQKNLQRLVHEGHFSQALYNELKESALIMPAIHELPDNELTMLTQGFADQIMPMQTFKNLLALTDKDKKMLCTDRPLSLRECKERVHDILVDKANKSALTEVTHFDPAYNIADPQLAHAVRLGKKALKDAQIMSMLWQHFKNQNKIAQLLGVNRSSVNRRCQEYNLKD